MRETNEKSVSNPNQPGERRTVYQISVVAEMVETHPQTLRTYEKLGLIAPQRTHNNVRLFSEEDVERVPPAFNI